MAERSRLSEGLSLFLTLVVVGAVAVVVGYLMGNYALKVLTRPEQQVEAPPQVSDEVPVTSAGRAEPTTGLATPATTTPKAPPASSEPSASPTEPKPSGPTPGPTTTRSGQAQTGQAQTAAVGQPALFRVQAGSFSQRANAERLASELAGLGYPTLITPTAPYKVQVGAFSRRDNAERLVAELKGKGYEAFVSH